MMKQLKDTVAWMTDGDYKVRFKAEYAQTKIRYEKLKRFCDEIEASHMRNDGMLVDVEEPQHDCPLELLRDQQHIMGNLLHILEMRAIIEHVDLSEVI